MVGVSSRLVASQTKSSTVWEKNVQDVNSSKDNYLQARDIGMARLNFNRLNLVAEVSKNDSVDYYKFNAISRGNMRITVREASSSETADATNVTKTDNSEKTIEDQKKELEDLVDSLKVKNVRVQVMTVNRGKETVVADSAGEEGSTELENFESLSLGEYRVKNPDMYYLKISRIDETKTSESYPYAVQIQIGDTHKYDYVSIEKKASESIDSSTTSTTSKTSSTKSTSSLSTQAQLALDNALQSTSAKFKSSQLAVNLLKNSSYWNSSSSQKSKVSFWS
ncbi:MAG: hypothetical protein AB7U85_02360 [Alphaproteobacteria bacterium]